MSDYKKRQKTWQDIGSGAVRHRIKERIEESQRQQPAQQTQQPTQPGIQPQRQPSLREAFPFAYSFKGSVAQREQTYWENPDKIVDWYTRSQADPTIQLPEGMDAQTLKGAYDYIQYQSKGIQNKNLWRLGADDPMREYLKNIPAPSNNFLSESETKIWGATDPKLLQPGGTSQADFKAPDFDWQRLTVEQKQEILKDPNFSIAKVTAPGQQGLIFSDSEFVKEGGRWQFGKGQLQWWQRPAFSILSNPKTTPAVQGAALTVMTKGKGLALAIPMTLLGYGAQSENEAIRVTSETLLKPFMWGAEKTEQVRGLASYFNVFDLPESPMEYTPAQITQTIPKVVLSAFQKTPQELAQISQEATQKLSGFISDPKIRAAVWEAGKSYYEITGANESKLTEILKADGSLTSEQIDNISKVANSFLPMMKEEGTVWVLGENQPVQVRAGYTLDDAAQRILNGESAGEVQADFAREYGISGTFTDFAQSTIYDPLNVVPEIISGARGKISRGKAGAAAVEAVTLRETPGISSVEKIAQLDARARIETAKATVYETTPGILGLEAHVPGTPLGITWGEAGKKFRALITSGAIKPEDARFMTKWERTVAGITPDGKIRELLPSPLEGRVPKFIETMLTLQPKAKAKMFLERYHTTVSSLFDWGKMTDATVRDLYDVAKSMANGDMRKLHDLGAEYLNTPEAYTILGAARDGVNALESKVVTYEAAGASRNLFWQIQSILGDPPKDLLKNFLDGDARADFKRLTETLQRTDLPEAKAMLAEIEAGRMTPDTLTKAFEPFRDGKVAIRPEEFSAQFINTMEDHMKTWGKDYFKLTKDSVWDDSLRLLKGAQSLLLLDLSPSAMVNDFINERVMMATTGTLGLTPHKVIDAWVKDFGFTPKEAGYGLLGDLPVKETDVVSSMTRGSSAIGSVADAVNKGRSYLLRPQASARFNAAHARQIFYKSAKTFWSKQWRAGVGFDRMPAALEGRLKEYGLDANTVYKNLEGVMSTKQLESINQRISNNNVNSFADNAAKQLGKEPAAVMGMLEELGIADELRGGLERAKTSEARQAAFDAIENKLYENFDQKQAQGLQNLLEQTRNKIKTEGGAGAVQAFRDIRLDYYDTGLMVDKIWGDTYRKAASVDNVALRRSIKADAARKTSAAWKRTQARQGALLQGAIEGLGLDTQFKRSFLGDLSEQHKVYRNYHEYRTRRITQFFDDLEAGKPVEWKDVELELRERYKSDVDAPVLEIQRKMDTVFVDEMKRAYGEAAGVTAKMWTDAAFEAHQRINESNIAFRDFLADEKNMPPQFTSTELWHSAAWEARKPELRAMYLDFVRIDMEGAGGLYKFGELPPEAHAPVAPDVGKFASIEEIANKYGIPTATETGIPNNRRLLATVKKYLGAEAADVNTYRDLTPEMVEKALQLREQAIKGEVTIPTEQVRFDDFEKTYDAALAKRKYTTQEKALNDLNAEVQRAWEALPDDADPAMIERLTELQTRVANEIKDLRNDVAIAEGMTQAEMDIRKAEGPLDTNTVQKNLKKVRDAKVTEETRAQELFPPGGYDQFTGYVDYQKILLDGYNTEVKPVMDAMREAAAQPETTHNFADMDADTQAQLNNWLRDTRSKMASTKHQAKAYGEAQRDFALLDYSRQYGFDKPLSGLVPYEFFGTRSAGTWLTRVADRPAWISQYVRLQNLHNTYQSQLPERTRNKLFVPMPFLPEWAGGGMFIDPTFQLFPFKQFTQPLDALRRDNEYIVNNASYILQNMQDDGLITKDQYDQAIANQTGPIWERAIEQAKIERGENKNGAADYFSMLLSPALYLTLPYYLATGKKMGGIQSSWPSGQLPITKFGQGLETAFKDTPLEWVGNIAGNLAKPEKALREAKGLNEFGEWGEYYIERQVANMVAEGVIDPKTGQMALIEKKGDIWDQANERVRQELMLKVPGMAPLYGAAHGATLDKIVGSVLPSLFPGGLLPPGEMEYKGLKQEYSLVWEAYKNGNKEAFTEFFDKHPEYSTRLALRRDPQERMTQFLKSEIWDAYGDLGPTDKKQATAFMGPQFQDFLDADSGVEFSNEQLATWSKMLNGMVPQTPETQGVGQTPQIDFFSPEVTRVTDKIFEERKEKFPNYYNLQSAYYNLPPSERKRFLVNFPEYAGYQKWIKQKYNDYPDLAPVIKGTVFKRIDTTNWPPSLLSVTQEAALTGDRLSSGTKAILEQVWISEGQPYGSFDSWVYNSVYPSLKNQMMQDISQ